MPPVRKKTNGISYEMHRHHEHARPHMHIYYSGGAASIALDTLDILAVTNVPNKQLKEALDWISRHQDELLQMWPNRMEPGGIYRIDD